MDEAYQNGMREFKNEKFPEAAVFYNQAVEDNDQNHKAWNALGVSYSKQGNNRDAEVCFENALILDPENATYQKNCNLIKKVSKKNPENHPYDKKPGPDKKEEPSNNEKTTPLSGDTGSSPPDNVFMRYFDTIKLFVLNPRQFFEETAEENWSTGLKIYIPLIIITAIVIGFYFYALLTLLFPYGETFLLIIIIILIIITGLTLLVLNSLFVHIGVILLGGGPNNGWNKTFKVVTYSSIPSLIIHWIPYIGTIIGFIWGFYLIITGLEVNHGLSTKRAFLAALSQLAIIVLIIALTVFSAAMMAAFVFGTAGNI